jgi:hypothetical protein
MKLAPDGTIEWQFSWGDQNQDMAYAATQTMDGGYIVGGESYAGGRILKLSADGNVEWSKMIVGVSLEVHVIFQTRDGGYILGGPMFSVIKLSSTGNIEWQSKFSEEFIEEVSSIQQTFDGGYIVAGSNQYGSCNIRVVKLGVRGDVQWQSVFPSPWTPSVGYGGKTPGCVRQTVEGGYILISDVPGQQAANRSDIWILKLFTTGEIDWQKIYGGNGSDAGFSIVQTADGGFIAACGIEDEFGFLKLTANGDLVSAQSFKNAKVGFLVWGRTIEQTQDGGFIVACAYQSYADLLVLKLLSDGTIGPTCKLVDWGSIPLTATSVVPIKIFSSPKDPGLVISPSSIDLWTAPFKTTLLLCQAEQEKKKGRIRR